MVPVELGKARRRAVVVSSFFAFAAIAVGAGWQQVAGAAQSSSDSRASFVEGNATTCAGVGSPSDVQVGSSSNGNAGDAHIEGAVKTNAGTTRPGQGQELDVATTGSGFVIDAIIVKGGPAYNLYTSPSVLPPTLSPDQHYISPFNGGGNVPSISHWFVCYRAAPSRTTTSTTKTTTTTTAAPTVNSSSSPPDTRSHGGTAIASAATTSTTAANEVSSRGSTIAPTPKTSTTTDPVVVTARSTRPLPSDITTRSDATTASAALPETGTSTASFVVGCATAILGLVLLALRPRG
jgi:hypothetical protein